MTNLVVRPVRHRSGRRGVRVRRLVPLRSAAVRRRRDGQPGVGARAGAAPACSRGDEARQIEAALDRRSSSTGDRDPAFVDGPDEDVHSFVERLLVERLGDAGRRLHTGRSRNEQVSLDLRLYLRRRIPLLQRAVAARRRGARRAGRVGGRRADAVVHALPSGAAGARRAFLPRARRRRCRRDFARLAAARDEADALPLGSGAIAGTSYAIDVDALARDLGFSRIVANSIDASSDRDFAATFLYAVRADDGASQPAGRGPDHLLRRRAPLLRALRRAQHRQQHDAAEEEPRSARARARQDRAAPSAISSRC